MNEEQFLRKLRYARTLAQSGKHGDALREYLLVFDESKSVAALVGARLTFLVTEIVSLGREYPPAIGALKARRDKMERLAREGQLPDEDLRAIQSINFRLGDSKRSMALYDALKAGTRSRRSAEALARTICIDLLVAKRRDDFIRVEGHCIRRLVDNLVSVELDQDFMADPDDSAADQKRLIRAGKERAFPVYEGLLSLGRTDTASRLKNWILSPLPDSHAFKGLIEAAVAAKKIEIARSLVSDARKQLPPSEMKDLDNVAKGVDTN